MFLRNRITSALFAFGIASIVTLTLTSHYDWAAGRTGREGEPLNILREIEIADLKVNGDISKSRTFSGPEFTQIIRQSQEAIRFCSELLTVTRTVANGNFRPLFADTEKVCLDVQNRNQAIRRFDQDNRLLSASLSRCHRSVMGEDDCPYIPELLRITHQIAIQNFPSKLELDELEESLNDFKLSKNSRTEDARVKQAISDVAVVIQTSRARLSLEDVIESTEYLNRFERLRAAYLGAYMKLRDSHAESFRHLAFACFAFLTFTLYFGTRLLETSRRLKFANANLEYTVGERTQEVVAATRQIETQQKVLAQNAKMSALGEMAGGIAHEINTPLAAISLHAELIELEPASSAGHAKDIISIVEKVSKIIIGLKRFARTSEADPRQSVAFQVVLNDTLLLCAEKFRSNDVDLQILVSDQNVKINCAPEQISQILMNLLNNAFDATETSTTRRIRITSEIGGGNLILKVVDSGPPLSNQVKEKLMQPFFTTKPIGKGTGLGLSISKGIAESHGGTLSLDPQNTETTFVLTLPISA